MPTRKEIAGRRFGELVAIERLPYTQGNNAMYACICDCGELVEIQMGKLTSGIRRNCGHDAIERIAAAATVHGLRFHPLYQRWANIKDRCQNPRCKDYHNYGGRGIYLCDRWQRPENFIEDMAPTYEEGLSVERVDNEGPYSPDNCTWATAAQQAQNTRLTQKHRDGQE